MANAASRNRVLSPLMLRRAAAAAAVAAFTLFYWRRLLVDGHWIVSGDATLFFFPSWSVGKRLLLDGAHVLWDPFRNMGQPFLAAPHNMALYPIRAFSAVLSYIDYQRIFVLFHVGLAATFAYKLGRTRFQSAAAGAVAALYLAFNDFFTTRAAYSTDFATMAWAPAALYFLLEKKPVALGVVFALICFAGFPPFAILTGIALVTAAAIDERRSVMFRTLGLGLLVGLGLGAIQWIPFLETFFASDRPLFLPAGAAMDRSIAPADLFRQLLLPGPLLAGAERGAILNRFHAGPVIVGLIAFGAFRRKRAAVCYGAAAAIALVLALGDHLGFYGRIPFITVFRFPGNWILLFTLFAGVAAAAGAAALPKAWPRWSAFGLLALELLALSRASPFPWVNAAFFERPAPVLSALTGAFTNGERVYHTQAARDAIQPFRTDTPENWAVFRAILLPSYGAAFGIREAWSPSNMALLRARRFAERLDGADPASSLFDVASIGKIIDRRRDGDGDAKRLAADLFEVRTNDARPGVFGAMGAAVDAFEIEPGRAGARARGAGRVVFSTVYANGWRATVNGEPRAVLPFEDAFVSVGVNQTDAPARVVFRYAPASVRWSAAVSAGTAAFVCFLAFARRRRRRAPG